MKNHFENKKVENTINIKERNYGEDKYDISFQTIYNPTFTSFLNRKAKDENGERGKNEKTNVQTNVVPNGLQEGDIKFELNVEGWTNQNVRVIVSTSEENREKYGIQTRKNNGNWGEETEIEFDENGIVSARLVDKETGRNAGEERTIKIGNIDKTAPEKPTYEAKYAEDNTIYPSGTWINKLVYTIISSYDDLSGIKQIECSKNKTTWTKLNLARSNGIDVTGNKYYGD